MIASRIRGALCFAIGAGFMGIVACESPAGPNAQPPAAAVSVVSGNGQVGQTGQTLSDPLAVRVASSSGVAVKGATVNFSVTAGTATVSPSSATTDSLGIAKTVVTLGASPGTITISAAVVGT